MSLQAPANLRCEYRVDPIGLGERHPRLSWEVRDDRRGATQSAWQVVASSSPEKLAAGAFDLWDSGRVDSDQSIHVPYAGRDLASRNRVAWKVRTWDAQGNASPWSATASFEIGLLARADWQSAQWIGSHLAGGPQTSVPVPFLRTVFRLHKPIASARLYITALGLYEAQINGQRVSDDVFRPGWTSYTRRVQYQAYDVAGHLRAGDNCLGALLGDGWYCGHVAWKGRQNYGDRPRLLAQLHLVFDDGSSQTIVTDPSWKYATGPIVESDMLMGESYDARKEMSGWSTPAFDDGRWLPVLTFDEPTQIVAQPGPPVRRMEQLAPIAPADIRAGWNEKRYIYDLGQNIAGWIRLKVRAGAGVTIRLRYAEMLTQDGNLYLENLRHARATDYYTCRGGGDETYEPRFTFHGFRYVEVRGPADLELGDDAVVGVVLNSDMPETGTFECDAPLVNQLQRNIRWGQKGNFIDVPTDCPQRDERLGWTGDAQVFIRTAAWNMDVAAFFTKWQQDLEDDQGEAGQIPCVAPDPDAAGRDGGPAWSDAVIICPWTIYLCYGDARLLERHYDSMAKFLAYLETTARDGIRVHPADNYHCFGDWLAIDAPHPGRAPTPKDLIGTAYFAHCANLMSRIAGIVDRPDDAQRYAALFQAVKAAFNREYVTPSGRIVGNSQTAYLLALGFDLLPDKLQAAALRWLVSDIAGRGWHLSTGFVGTPLLAPVLSRFGRTDIAYKLLLQETYPGWLYSILQGATTMWERWNSYTRDKGFGDAGMNSFNHYAYGCIGEWMYATVAGIDLDPARPAYKHIVFRPEPGPGINRARASLKSIHGLIEAGWRNDDGRFSYDLAVPANTTATLRLPARSLESVTENGSDPGKSTGVRFVGFENHQATYELAAGRYAFASDLPHPPRQ